MYRYLYALPRGALKRELTQQLRQQRATRRPKHRPGRAAEVHRVAAGLVAVVGAIEGALHRHAGVDERRQQVVALRASGPGTRRRSW